MHPDLYLHGVTHADVTLPDFFTLLPAQWKQLDENAMGEFGVQEVLKQFLSAAQAQSLSPAWAGDRYAIFENQQTKQDLLIFRLRLDSDADAAHYFDLYGNVLEAKDATRTNEFRAPNFLSFDTPAGGVFFRCVASECLSMEGTTRDVFDRISHVIGWPAAPAAASDGAAAPARSTNPIPLLLPTLPEKFPEAGATR
jgi:hypothetical protein